MIAAVAIADFEAASVATFAAIKAAMAAKGHDLDESDKAMFQAGFGAGAKYMHLVLANKETQPC